MNDTRTPEGVDTTTGEVVPLGTFNPRAEMINTNTDSWTAVYQDARALAVDVATSELTPEAVRGDAKRTLALILYGRELGLPPLTSLKNVFVIKGRANVYAETMRAMIIGRGHKMRAEELTDTRCVMLGCRKDDDPAILSNWVRYEYTMQDATRAGDVAKNPNYKSRPKDMLLARATTGLAKLHFADVIGGLDSVEAAVTADDVLDSVTGDQAAPAASPAAAPRTSVQRTRSRVKPSPVSTNDEPADVVDAQVIPDTSETAQDGSAASGTGDRARPAASGRPEPVPGRPVADSGPTGDDGQPAFEDADASTGPSASSAQVAKLGAQMNRLGFGTDREGRLNALARLVGHPVQTSKDLTRTEADYLIDQTSKCRDRASFDALLAVTTKDEGADA